MKSLIAILIALAAAVPTVAQEIRTEDDLAATLERGYQKAIEKAGPCVVALKVEREPEPAAKPAPAAPGGRGRLRGLLPEDVFAKRPADAWCTGTLVEADGLILTTQFNISGTVRSIKVLLSDGREFEGKLLGFNGTYDLAAVKIDATGLPVLEKAPLDDLRTGSSLVALGRAPDGKGITANPGIVSAPSRLSGRGIQTDARLNFGNVGGPLVDAKGRLVAISCKVDVNHSSTRGQNSGVGFAVTHDRIADVLPDLKSGKNVAEARRAFLGIEADQKGAEGAGVPLASVRAGGAAEKAGLKGGDVIVEIDGKKITYFDELRAAITRRSPGDRISVKVRRGEEVLEFECELGWAPEE